jgi:hypothetical protein
LISGLEAQRGTLADEIVEPAVATLREKLAVLEQQAAAPLEEHPGQAARSAVLYLSNECWLPKFWG